MRTGYSKSEKMDPWVSKSEGKGTKSEPTGTKREPKVSQGAIKMHQKIGLRRRSRKGSKKALRVKMKWMTFGSHFPSKINEKNDAKIDAEKVMKNHEKTMQK